MGHWSEDKKSLAIVTVTVTDPTDFESVAQRGVDIGLFVLPNSAIAPDSPQENMGEVVARIVGTLDVQATLIIVGEVVDLVDVQAKFLSSFTYRSWIVIKRKNTCRQNQFALPNQHFGALIYTKYQQGLRHTKTRLQYTYCPVCDRTTKDYGGKKHTYHEFGTLISDVWRDLEIDLTGDLNPLIERFADLFGVEPYQELLVLDCRQLVFSQSQPEQVSQQLPLSLASINALPKTFVNTILLGDCIENLQKLPANSVDFVFTDPPYNLKKSYLGYQDDQHIEDYFNWCDRWLAEIIRVLKPGRTLALLNIPLWAIRHFLFLRQHLQFQNWIVWDALAFPVRLIMPAHYTILCFTKGPPRELPGFIQPPESIALPEVHKTFRPLEILADHYCLRSDCVERRSHQQINDHVPITDMWTDIHRLKHNSRRVDHPCQLPPALMYRLLTLFTYPEEMVLDCFNGAGTTTLAAHRLGRQYLGIEVSPDYYQLALDRHQEVANGLNPFRKADRDLTAKNSPVPRFTKQKYAVSKKQLQLEVKRIAQELGHLPDRQELAQHTQYTIDYYDRYFASWGEVCAAARTTGMSETK
ncbi:DNA methyltransferase [Pantanalinema rosaneae CENA516]|uniref:DNA methyltransferase n=1 Tax=Pantanalinema rosaneae TaxID=1620701 RepID=UPI003D6DF272